MKRYIITALLSILFISLHSANYYCSPTGFGNGTSYFEPCSFTDGVNKLKAAGDTLFCLDGQYDFTTVINITNTAGNASHNVVICNYPGEKPILDWRQQAYGERGIVLKSATQYMTIKGLTLRYTGKNAILNNGSYCTFENLDVYGNGDTGIQMKGGGNNMIINCDSHDNFDYRLGGINAADFGGNADGFADKQFTGGPNTYIGCRAWNNSDDGWDFFQRITSGTTPTMMINCICYKNGPNTYNMTNHGRYETDKSWFDQFLTEITITDADGTKIQASITKYPNIGNGNGFKLGGGYTGNAVTLYNCLAVANKARGFDQNNNYGPMVVYNGSAYLNGTDYGFGTAGDGSLIIKNCISYKNTTSFKVTTTQSNNSWSDNKLNATAADFISLDTTLILLPRNNDGSLPEITFMHLQPDSKFIDAGTDVGLSFEGLAPDLGCYEYGSSISYPATLTCITNNLSQGIKQGNEIENISLKWGGSATGAQTSPLPDGLIAQINENDRTITISGKPTTSGTINITVTTTGGTSEASANITIIIKDNSAYEIGYVTLTGSEADQPILDKLNANTQFSVNIIDASNTNNNYDKYDLIIISPVPSSTAPAMASLEGIDKPMLLLKPFMLKNTVWNWGNSQNTPNAAMKIIQPNHYIFTHNNPFINNNVPSTIDFFTTVNTNGVTYIANWFSKTEPIQIATPITAEGSSIAEIKAGTDMNGTVISQPLIMIGISEYSTANLTYEALQIIENACYYLLKGAGTETAITTDNQFTITQNNGTITVNGANKTITLYDIVGRKILTSETPQITTNNLSAGIYIIQTGNHTLKIQIK